MRKVFIKFARADKFDASVSKYCDICPALDDCKSVARDIERFGYAELPLSAKLSILKALCEAQFDWNYKFKETVRQQKQQT